MKFKINLNPHPGEPYFTVREHKTKFDSIMTATELVNEVVQGIKTLLHIAEDSRFTILTLNQKEQLRKNINPYVILDDPSSGSRIIDTEELLSNQGLIDLSYSLPYIPKNVSAYDHCLIDPNASLSVPCDCMFLFSNSDAYVVSEGMVKDTTPKNSDLFVLRGVLHDILDKGLDQNLREANYKAAVLYQLIDSHPEMMASVEKTERSKTCISAICSPEFRSAIQNLGYDFFVSNENDLDRITIANYLTHSKESVEMFADRVAVL